MRSGPETNHKNKSLLLRISVTSHVTTAKTSTVYVLKCNSKSYIASINFIAKCKKYQIFTSRLLPR